jgi:DNA-binding winged helix-turn-helix (wHTH) protein/tetratricopeptide (TPR) repeat protein
MTTEVFQFAECEVFVGACELRVRGVHHPLEPRPFKVLAHLLHHRRRLVTSDELLREFWPAGAGSANGVSRAVMKIRRAIGSGTGDALIRTVHRGGYRFVGEVVSRRGPPGMATPDAVLVGIALLPFDNLTGAPDLDWVELGLVSLLARDLGAHAKLRVPTVPSVLSALQTASPQERIEDRAATVRRLLGVDRVVHGKVLLEGGRFVLRAIVIDDERSSVEEVSCAEPAALAGLLGRRLIASWFGADSRLVVRVEPAGVAGRQRFVQALQAIAEQQWSRALGLLDAALELDPHDLSMHRERLRALVALDDNRAFDFGNALLTRVAECNDVAIAAAVHLELAQAYVKRRLTRQARLHLDKTLSQATDGVSVADLTATTMLRASVAMNGFDFPQAGQFIQRAARLCDLHGNVFDRIRLNCLLVVYEAETGNMVAAHDHAKTAATMYRDHGVMAGHARALTSLANASASLGRLKEAVKHAEAALAMSRSLASPTDTAIAATTLCGLHKHLRQRSDLERALAALEEVDTADSPSTDLFHLIGRSQRALAIGRFGDATDLLSQARRAVEASGQHLELHFVLPLLVGALVCAGRLLDAEHVRRDIERLPLFARDANLQGGLLHGRAQLAHATGNDLEALALLRAAIDATAPGWWNAQACLDAAWLCLELGAPDEASALLVGAEAWMTGHPVGLLIRARLHHATGRFEEARTSHQLLVTTLSESSRGFFDLLARCYERGRRQPASLRFPRAPRLATWI